VRVYCALSLGGLGSMRPPEQLLQPMPCTGSPVAVENKADDAQNVVAVLSAADGGKFMQALQGHTLTLCLLIPGVSVCVCSVVCVCARVPRHLQMPELG
jgi:hypothetical protein